jgi:hypothetical protein
MAGAGRSQLTSESWRQERFRRRLAPLLKPSFGASGGGEIEVRVAKHEGKRWKEDYVSSELTACGTSRKFPRPIVKVS